jgi:glucan 1,3-beta-glucosidase
MSDVTTVGGAYGLNIGSQQFTMRGLTISNAVVGINQIWNWGWTYQGLNINNCGTAISISNGGIDNQAVGSVVILDSTIQNTPKFVETAYTSTTYSNGSLWLENIQLSNVATAVHDNSNAVLAGSSGSMTISGWGQGHSYSPSGPRKFQGPMAPASRPSALLASGTSNYLTQSKPQYEASPVASFLSVRAAGAKGDGQTDDTAALNAALQSAAASNQIIYIDQGTYVISDTLMVPAGSRIVGEAYPVLLATGSNFANINQPKAVVQIGNAGDTGLLQWSDTIVGTRGSTPGAILVEWNLAATAGSGMWDVHARIGGFAGSNLQVQQCPTTAGVSSSCEAAYMALWVRSSAKNVYLENVWLWTADHDMDSAANTQISVYTGRGLLVEGSNVWL